MLVLSWIFAKQNNQNTFELLLDSAAERREAVLPASLLELPPATLLLLTRFLSTKGEAGSLCLLMVGEVEGDKSIGSSATQSPAQGADLDSGQIKFSQYPNVRPKCHLSTTAPKTGD